jgi:hypothetical protein
MEEKNRRDESCTWVFAAASVETTGARVLNDIKKSMFQNEAAFVITCD